MLEGKSIREKKIEQTREWSRISLEEHMEIYESKGLSRKEAMKQVAADRGVPKREIYQYFISDK